ncbi:MAG: hypothetical protein ACRCX2_30995 [Paraclostridium sp.]
MISKQMLAKLTGVIKDVDIDTQEKAVESLKAILSLSIAIMDKYEISKFEVNTQTGDKIYIIEQKEVEKDVERAE